MKYFISIVLVIVGGAIIVAAFFVGSPQQARQKKIDEVKRSALQNVSWSIQEYYDKHEELPENLEALPRVILDPETKEPYAYEVVDDSTYMLCASFYFAKEEPSAYIPVDGEENFRTHGAGKHCFTKNINTNPLPLKMYR